MLLTQEALTHQADPEAGDQQQHEQQRDAQFVHA